MSASGVFTTSGHGWVRYSVYTGVPATLYETWIYTDGRPTAHAVDCAPVRRLPDNAAGWAIRKAITEAANARVASLGRTRSYA